MKPFTCCHSAFAIRNFLIGKKFCLILCLFIVLYLFLVTSFSAKVVVVVAVVVVCCFVCSQ